MQKNKIIVILSFAFFTSNLPAETKRIIMPCENVTTKLSYTSYGVDIKQKEGWKCEASVDKKSSKVRMVRWLNATKNIGFIDVPFRKEGDKRSVDEIVRTDFEAFLGEKQDDPDQRSLYYLYENKIKGILFGARSEKIAIYFEDANRVVAFIYKKDADHYLNMGCSRCTLQEFLSDIVIPALQNQ